MSPDFGTTYDPENPAFISLDPLYPLIEVTEFWFPVGTFRTVDRERSHIHEAAEHTFFMSGMCR